MPGKIIIIEGPDECGKSTLGRALAKRYNCVYWRLTASDKLNHAMKDYQINCMDNIRDNIEIGNSIVIDRFWPSDDVYGHVFRNGPSFDHMPLIQELNDLGAVYIMAYSVNAIERHSANKDPDHPYEDEDFNKVITGYKILRDWMDTQGDFVEEPYCIDHVINSEIAFKAYLDGMGKYFNQ